MKRPSRILSLSLLSLATMISPLAGQDADKPQPVTSSDPEIAVDHLDLLLEPLTQAELGVEAEGWRDLVKASVQELSAASIASRKVSEEKAEGQRDAGAADAEKERHRREAGRSCRTRRPPCSSASTPCSRAYEKKGGDADRVPHLRHRGVRA